MPTGLFVAVVGPSGSGKDTVMRLACLRLAGEPRVHFVRRAITRPADESEDHEPLTADAFSERLARGGFALHWHAHGLSYGLPEAVIGRVERGDAVVANVSRTVLSEIAERFPRHVVLEISADPEVRAQRIGDRRRDSDGPTEARIRRAIPIPPQCLTCTIDNNADPERAAAAFTEIVLQRLDGHASAG